MFYISRDYTAVFEYSWNRPVPAKKWNQIYNIRDGGGGLFKGTNALNNIHTNNIQQIVRICPKIYNMCRSLKHIGFSTKYTAVTFSGKRPKIYFIILSTHRRNITMAKSVQSVDDNVRCVATCAWWCWDSWNYEPGTLNGSCFKFISSSFVQQVFSGADLAQGEKKRKISHRAKDKCTHAVLTRIGQSQDKKWVHFKQMGLHQCISVIVSGCPNSPNPFQRGHISLSLTVCFFNLFFLKDTASIPAFCCFYWPNVRLNVPALSMSIPTWHHQNANSSSKNQESVFTCLSARPVGALGGSSQKIYKPWYYVEQHSLKLWNRSMDYIFNNNILSEHEFWSHWMI